MKLRHGLMVAAGAALALPAGASGSSGDEAEAGALDRAARKKDSKRPNVIFILMDDAGYGDFGCYGQQKIETPNIDALAQAGIVFTDMYAGAPVSAPSRCTLMTGLHSGHAQIRSNDELLDRGDVWKLRAMIDNPELEGQYPMAAGTTTIASVMQDAGYKTSMVGKWGLGGPTSESTPSAMGFDLFYGYMCQRMAQCYYPMFLYRNNEREYLDNPFMELSSALSKDENPYDIASYARFKGNDYSPDKMYDEVSSFIQENRNDEFFLMWTTTLPHAAFQAPDELVDYYVKKFGEQYNVVEEPVYNGKGYFPCRYPKATYAAMLTYFDMQVGKMIEELKRLGIYENTIIMFSSDNGPTHNAYTSTNWFDCAAPFRSDKGWTKRSLHEGGIRIPFIVSWGSKIAHQVSDHIGFFPDVMPTLCDIAKVKCPQTDGISILPMLQGKKQKEHEYLYWEFPPFKTDKGWLCVRMGEWKGLVTDVATGNNTMKLYRINEDPREENDLAAQYPEVVAKMWEHIRESHTPSDHPLFNLEITYP